MNVFHRQNQDFNLTRRKSEGGPPSWTSSVVLFIVFLVGLGVYYRSLGGDFVNVDDLHYIKENGYIRDFSWNGVFQIFSQVIVANYFPLQILSYAIDFAIWGLNPWGYRFTNLLFHVGNGYLVYLIFRRLLKGGFWLPLAGSLIFVLHPVNVESVAWISERKNVLSSFFLLVSFLFYFRYLDGRSRGASYAGSLGFFLLALLAKVSAVVLPCLLILYDICWTSRSPREWVKDKIPFLAITVFFSWLAVQVYQMQKIIPAFHGGHPIYTFMTMVKVVVEYILSFFFPVPLYLYYEVPLVRSFWEAPFLLSLSLMAILGFLSVRWIRSRRPLGFCCFWFFIALLPVLNIVPITILRADRYLYLPSVGFAFLLIWGIPKILYPLGRKFPWGQPAAFGLILVFLAFLAVKQTHVWQSTYHLWTHTLQYSSKQAPAFMGLGEVMYNRGHIRLATSYYQEAVRLAPQTPEILNRLGVVYMETDKLEEARDLFERAWQINPAYEVPQINLGILYHKMGDDSLAIAALQRALKTNKSRAMIKNNLGVIYRQRGDLKEAKACFLEAVSANPSLLAARLNLASTFQESGQLEAAIVQFEEVLKAQPRSFYATYHLGQLYLEKGLLYHAVDTLTVALKTRPEDPEINFYLAMAYRSLPQGNEKALFHFQKALEKEKDPERRAEWKKKWRAVEEKLEEKRDLRS